MTARVGVLAVAVLGSLLLASPAEARFGKRSNPSSSSSSDSDSDSKDSSSSSDSSTHEARPVRPHVPSAPPAERPRRYRHSHHPSPHPAYAGYYYGWGFGYYPVFWAPAPPPRIDAAEEVTPTPTFTLGVAGQVHQQKGTTLWADIGAEGDRWGARTALSGIFVPTDDGTSGVDSIGLIDLHLTYAPLRGPHGRLRAELGANIALAPDLMVLSPDVGLSGVLALAGPLGLEATAYYTPWPIQRVDAFGGLTLSFAQLGLRAGWRHLWLDDRGVLEGDVRHTDTFTGPFLGLSFAL